MILIAIAALSLSLTSVARLHDAESQSKLAPLDREIVETFAIELKLKRLLGRVTTELRCVEPPYRESYERLYRPPRLAPWVLEAQGLLSEVPEFTAYKGPSRIPVRLCYKPSTRLIALGALDGTRAPVTLETVTDSVSFDLGHLFVSGVSWERNAHGWRARFQVGHIPSSAYGVLVPSVMPPPSIPVEAVMAFPVDPRPLITSKNPADILKVVDLIVTLELIEILRKPAPAR